MCSAGCAGPTFAQAWLGEGGAESDTHVGQLDQQRSEVSTMDDASDDLVVGLVALSPGVVSRGVPGGSVRIAVPAVDCVATAGEADGVR